MSGPFDGMVPPVAQRAALTVYVGQLFGLSPQVTSGWRSMAKQAALWNTWQSCLRTGETVSPSNPNPACRYPVNLPENSAHVWGLAWDSWVPKGQWPMWNAVRAALGWHLLPNDRVHAEVPDWRTVRNELVRLGYYPNAYAPASSLAATAPTTPSATPTPPPPAIGPQTGSQRPRDYTSAPPGSWMCAQEVKNHPGYDVWCAGVKQG